jgi:peptidoglycan/LPS O-acetylase OafA/YrhL
VLNHWQQPLKGELTAYHKHILPENFRRLIESNERCTWDNAYTPLASGNPWAANFVGRVAAALLGGLALIAPMLVMALPDASTKELVTTSVAVVLIAIGLASASHSSWRDVLGITAAYTAVLIVFVGTSSSRPVGQGRNKV